MAVPLISLVGIDTRQRGPGELRLGQKAHACYLSSDSDSHNLRPTPGAMPQYIKFRISVMKNIIFRKE